MATRQSTDSAGPAAPLLKTPHLPPPHTTDDSSPGAPPSKEVQVARIVQFLRVLVVVFGVPGGIDMSTRLDGAAARAAFHWILVIYNVFQIMRLSRSQNIFGYRISFVSSSGSEVFVIGRRESDDSDGPSRRCFLFRAFVIDIILTSVLFSLDIALSVEYCAWNCLAGGALAFIFGYIIISLQIFIIIFTINSKCITGRICFERVERPQHGNYAIRLPPNTTAEV
ncbi:hypothetical protein F5Y16DRAFT_400233 [Xylariaceae sp. FL0255]|nr:hypothetical protein F5Y16DRAFT_400233 [Xylariaceae sp. FL0255]